MRRRLCAAGINEVLEADYVALDIGPLGSPENTEPPLVPRDSLNIVLSKEQVNDLTIREVSLNKGKCGVVE